MVDRYPHIGKLVVSLAASNPNGIAGTGSDEFEIQGRFEPTASKSKSIDYKAKFYCREFVYQADGIVEPGFFSPDFIEPHTRRELMPFSVDGQRFKYGGREFEVIMFHNYQTHSEIWLD